MSLQAEYDTLKLQALSEAARHLLTLLNEAQPSNAPLTQYLDWPLHIYTDNQQTADNLQSAITNVARLTGWSPHV